MTGVTDVRTVRRDHRGDGRRDNRQVDSTDRRPAQDSDRWNDSKSSDKLDEWEKAPV